MKAWLATILITGGVALSSPSASAQVYPACPPGYVFAPAYGLCYPAGYAYDPGYYYDQGYPFYPYAWGFGDAPFFFGGRFGGFHHFHHGFHHGFEGHRFAGHGGHFAARR